VSQTSSTRTPPLDAREERTLAELDRQETDNDPVLKLEARRTHLRHLATQTMTSMEHEVIDRKLADLEHQLRIARREQLLQQTFDRYIPTVIDEARATRITTLAHDTLGAQPCWVVGHIRYLHDNDQLTTCDVPTMATRITRAAALLDQTGHLPNLRPAPQAVAVDLPEPALELG
jgi:hypothetical protein